MKKQSNLSRLLTYAGAHRGLTVLGCALSGFAAILGLIPFVCVWLVARDVLAVYPNVTGAAGLARWGWMAVWFAVGNIALYFAALIPRFWNVESGTVRIGGADVLAMDRRRLMEQVAFVFQDTRLLKMSILENLLMARPNATEKEVCAALSAAQCDDIIRKLTRWWARRASIFPAARHSASPWPAPF